ncbi:hypothetical protein BCR33DRAFT_720364, partial [Rhizoclosmatium globosum]
SIKSLQTVCTVMGILFQFSITSISCWSLVLTFFCYLTVMYSPRVAKKYWLWFHCYVWTSSILFSCILLITQVTMSSRVVGDSLFECWISDSYPWLRIILFYTPAWIHFIAIICLYIAMINKVSVIMKDLDVQSLVSPRNLSPSGSGSNKSSGKSSSGSSTTKSLGVRSPLGLSVPLQIPSDDNSSKSCARMSSVVKSTTIMEEVSSNPFPSSRRASLTFEPSLQRSRRGSLVQPPTFETVVPPLPTSRRASVVPNSLDLTQAQQIPSVRDSITQRNDSQNSHTSHNSQVRKEATQKSETPYQTYPRRDSLTQRLDRSDSQHVPQLYPRRDSITARTDRSESPQPSPQIPRRESRMESVRLSLTQRPSTVSQAGDKAMKPSKLASKKRMIGRAGIYTIGFLISWGPATAQRIMSMIPGTTIPEWLNILIAVCFALSGLWNPVVFFVAWKRSE